jgi:hypothetical protein
MKQSILARIMTMLLCSSFIAELQAQTTLFTYQGRLFDNGQSANGTNYGMVFYLYDAPTNGNLLGNEGIVSVTVSNGLFTVPLDFGNVFDGNPRWLEVSVEKTGPGGDSGFTPLFPLQQITPTPYAIFANTASNLSGVLPAAQISGAVSSGNFSGTYGNAVTLNNAGNSFNGSFSGDGANVTNVNATTLNGLNAENFWQTTGNAGTTPDANFVGTTDNQPLELRVHGVRALRLEPNTKGAPNVIGGAPINYVSSGSVGATIGGGGATNYPANIGGKVTVYTNYINSVTGDFGTVGGGYENTSGTLSTVSGGRVNTASGDWATVGGGEDNTASADDATVGGGGANTASGSYATVGGGFENTASGTDSFAAGYEAQALHQGAFVWADSQGVAFSSTANDQFLIRAQGGVGINTNNPNGASLYVSGNQTGSGANAFRQPVGWFENASAATGSSPALRVVVDGGDAPSGALSVSDNGTGPIAEFGNASAFVASIENDGTIVSKGVALTSDRNVKENFAPLDATKILAKVATLPVTEWNYKDDGADEKHIGPMAQDFHAAFGLNGADDKHISVIDEGGVALAAIQGLNQKLQEELNRQDAENAKLKLQNDLLAERLNELAATVKSLAQTK